MTVRTGVVGAGTMGVGVSQAFASAGHPVVLVDVSATALAQARARIRHDLRFAALTGHRNGAGPHTLDLITFTTDHERLSDAEYVVENITENAAAKQDLYRVLDEVCSPRCVLAANTSAIPITRLAAATDRPEVVIGNHYMNPAHLMPLVEVIRGVHTTDETVARSRAVLSGIGKKSVVVADSPGFVTNRVLMLTINEAIFLLHEGVSTATDVDHLFRQCFGHRMGPLETADLIGLDTVLFSLRVLFDEFNDPKYRPCPLLRKYVDAGLLGRKTGRGFHHYDELAPAPREDVR